MNKKKTINHALSSLIDSISASCLIGIEACNLAFGPAGIHHNNKRFGDLK